MKRSGRTAIRQALHRLGMQAGPAQVVRELGNVGVVVSEGMVRAVKVEMLKEADRRRRSQGNVTRPPTKPVGRQFQKVISRRSQGG